MCASVRLVGARGGVFYRGFLLLSLLSRLRRLWWPLGGWVEVKWSTGIMGEGGRRSNEE